MLAKEIIKLRKLILAQATLIEKMLTNSINGLIVREEKLLQGVLEDEKRVNEAEIKIDKICTKIFALFQPEAKDLRKVFMMSRMNYDLERMGDHCKEIATSALYLISRPSVYPIDELQSMFDNTRKMLKDSLNSFINEDVDLAFSVCKSDQVIDDIHEKIINEFTTFMVSDPLVIERALHMLKICNNVEKIADLTTNISEHTVYIVKGQIIKHHNF